MNLHPPSFHHVYMLPWKLIKSRFNSQQIAKALAQLCCPSWNGGLWVDFISWCICQTINWRMLPRRKKQSAPPEQHSRVNPLLGISWAGFIAYDSLSSFNVPFFPPGSNHVRAAIPGRRVAPFWTCDFLDMPWKNASRSPFVHVLRHFWLQFTGTSSNGYSINLTNLEGLKVMIMML